jgi:hypothetical protein
VSKEEVQDARLHTDKGRRGHPLSPDSKWRIILSNLRYPTSDLADQEASSSSKNDGGLERHEIQTSDSSKGERHKAKKRRKFDKRIQLLLINTSTMARLPARQERLIGVYSMNSCS